MFEDEWEECPSWFIGKVLPRRKLKIAEILLVGGLLYTLIKGLKAQASIAKTHQMAKMEVSQVLAPWLECQGGVSASVTSS